MLSDVKQGMGLTVILTAVCTASLSLSYFHRSSVSNASALICCVIFYILHFYYFLLQLIYKKSILTSPREPSFSVM